MEDEGSVSAYEIYSSGLVEVLLQLLRINSHNRGAEISELENLRIKIFVKCFKVDQIFYFCLLYSNFFTFTC